MKKRSTWYSEKGTEERPCSFDPNLVALVRCGKLVGYVPKKESK